MLSCVNVYLSVNNLAQTRPLESVCRSLRSELSLIVWFFREDRLFFTRFAHVVKLGDSVAALVTRYLRNLHGDSQPILVEANDGHLYVVKLTDNLHGPHLLFNESMGTELYRACGLPVAPWKALKVTGSFLDRNLACWSETLQGRLRPAAGLYFGSRFLGGQGHRLFEILPGSYFQRVKNAADFWRAWMLDVCADHSDVRQAIFREELSGQLEAVFIDFGHMFGGATGIDPFRHVLTSRYRDERIYAPIKPKSLLQLRKIADTLDVDQLWRQLAAIPDEWTTRSAIQNFTECLNRLSNASSLERTLDAMVKGHQLTESEILSVSRRRQPAVSILRTLVQHLARCRGVAAY